MITLQLDSETETYLGDILEKENTNSEELLKRLIYQHWQNLQSRKTIVERRGGHPQSLLKNASPELSTRENRKKAIVDRIQQKHQRIKNS